MSINHITLAGNVTRDPELRRAGQGQVLKFGLAVSDSWVNKATGNRDERTDFFDCEVWGARAEALARIVRKGMKLTVCGQMRSNQREMQDGSKRTFWAVRVSEVELPAKDAQAAQGGVQGAPAYAAPADFQAAVTAGFQAATGAAYYDEDVPF